MQSQEQKENSNKVAAIIIAVLVIAGGAFAAYKTGLIPGFGEGSKTAQELKADTEALKGDAIKTKIVQYLKSDKFMSYLQADQKEKFQQGIDKVIAESTVDFSYTDLKTSSGEGKGSVVIMAPKLSLMSQAENSGIEFSSAKLVVSRSVKDKNDYFFSDGNPLDVFINKSGEKTKLFSISDDGSDCEMRFDEAGNLLYSKSQAKNIKFIEGRGNTVVLTIGEAYSESSESKQGGNMESSAKISYKNIIPGDMIKIMLGNIDPVSINFDYSYKGDDLDIYLNKLAQGGKTVNTELKTISESLNGNLDLRDFSVLMGDAGIVVSGNLTFKKETPKPIPSGVVNLKLAQYQKLIAYFKRFYPVPQEQIDNAIKMLDEIGHDNGGDIVVDIKFDGTENILIGGKTTQEVTAIREKYFPHPATVDTSLPAPVNNVKSQPLSPVKH